MDYYSMINVQPEYYGAVRSTQTRFTWTIDGFEHGLHKCKSIMSPIFTTVTDNFVTKWGLTLYPNGLHREYQDDMAISIQCLNRSLIANVQLSVLNNDGIDTFIHSIHCDFNGAMWVNSAFLKRSTILGDPQRFYIQNGAIHIVCIITTNETIQTDNAKMMNQKNQLQKLTEFSKFKCLLNDETFSDVIFCIGTEKIKAHKAILACSSSVFKAMFTHRMSEKNSNQVKIEDVDSNTIKAMLKFIYTGDLEQFDSDRYDSYLKLLIAAEKYCIENLKEKCQEVLTKELTVDNVLDCIVNADFHNAVALKAAAIDFAVGNAEKVVEAPAFEEFLNSNTTISCEVVRVLVTKKRRLN